MRNLTLRFTKVTGAGNDFILFDTLNHVVPFLGEEMIRTLCQRGLGVGADGILILSLSQNADFKVNYYNADGSSGMLCANGARCAVVYAKKFLDIRSSQITFECCGEKYSAEVLKDNVVRFSLNKSPVTKTTTITIQDSEYNLFYANTGAEHVVLEYSEIKDLLHNFSDTQFDSFNMNSFGKLIRNHPSFQPDGVNVNVIEIENDNKIKIRSYEKGVENETLACGTGIIAAALFLSEKHNYNSPIEIWSRSNRKFIVEFNKKDGKFTDVKLTGEAEIVYFGEIIPEDYSRK